MISEVTRINNNFPVPATVIKRRVEIEVDAEKIPRDKDDNVLPIKHKVLGAHTSLNKPTTSIDFITNRRNLKKELAKKAKRIPYRETSNSKPRGLFR